MNRNGSIKEALTTASSALARLSDEVTKLQAESQKAMAGNDNRKKLTLREVSRIRSLKKSGWKQAAIADAFDLNPATVSRIVRAQYWR